MFLGNPPDCKLAGKVEGVDNHEVEVFHLLVRRSQRGVGHEHHPSKPVVVDHVQPAVYILPGQPADGIGWLAIDFHDRDVASGVAGTHHSRNLLSSAIAVATCSACARRSPARRGRGCGAIIAWMTFSRSQEHVFTVTWA